MCHFKELHDTFLSLWDFHVTAVRGFLILTLSIFFENVNDLFELLLSIFDLLSGLKNVLTVLVLVIGDRSFRASGATTSHVEASLRAELGTDSASRNVALVGVDHATVTGPLEIA